MAGAFIGGVVIDYSKAFKEVAVVSYSLAILAFVWFYEVSSREWSYLLILITHSLTYILGIHFEWAGGGYCLLSVCVWILCTASHSGLYGVGSGDHLPCL